MHCFLLAIIESSKESKGIYFFFFSLLRFDQLPWPSALGSLGLFGEAQDAGKLFLSSLHLMDATHEMHACMARHTIHYMQAMYVCICIPWAMSMHVAS
jgi:hypothetical protein